MRKKVTVAVVWLGMLAAMVAVTWGAKGLFAWGTDAFAEPAQSSTLETILDGISVNDVAEKLRTIWAMAEAGNPEARKAFPKAWSGGEGGEHDLELARDRKAASLGLASGKVRLAARYRTGDGVEQDFGEARRLYLEAAEDGSAEGLLGLAELHFHGEGVPQSHDEALRLFRQAAEAGSVVARRRLGDMYRDGLGVEASDEEAVVWYRKAAEMGDPEASLLLGEMYVYGRGVETDQYEAWLWISEAADLGVARAEWVAGALHLKLAETTGLGQELGITYLGRAAAQGNERAAAKLTELYIGGEIPPRRLEGPSAWPGSWNKLDDAATLNNFGVWLVENSTSWEAIAWALGRASALGDARAELNLGLLYLEGELVETSLLEAVRHFRNAAAKGSPEAMNELGVCYATGRGVRLDSAEAIKWYRKAAEAGDANAQFNLAMLYVRGEGVEQDYREALQWLELAAAQGDPVVVGVRERITELEQEKRPNQISS